MAFSFISLLPKFVKNTLLFKKCSARGSASEAAPPDPCHNLLASLVALWTITVTARFARPSET